MSHRTVECNCASRSIHHHPSCPVATGEAPAASPEPVGYQRREKMKWPGKPERWKWVGTIYPSEILAASCRSAAVLDFETRALYTVPPSSEADGLRIKSEAWRDVAQDLFNERDKLASEIRALREALKEIEDYTLEYEAPENTSDFRHIRQIARTALDQAKGD